MTEVVSCRPTPDELRLHVRRPRAGADASRPAPSCELSTEDCFGGKVRSVDDLPCVVCEFPYLNPVTGPFHVEGAEPGDTLAVHFVAIAPARDWARVEHVPALRRADRDAHHGDAAPAAGGAGLALRRRRRRGRRAGYHARRSDFTVELPLDPMHGTVGVAPAAGEVR